MRKRKLLKTFSLLNNRERQSLVSYCKGEYVSRNKLVFRLFSFLLKKIGNTKSQLLEADVWKSLYADRPYNDQEFRLLLSEAQQILEQFLITEAILNMPVKSNLILLQIFQEKQADKSFVKQFEKTEKLHKKQKERDLNFLEEQVDLNWKFNQFLEEQDRGGKINLSLVSEAIELRFIAEKLKVACFQIAHERVFNTVYEKGFLPEVLNRIENNNDLLKHPAIAIYYYYYNIITENKETYYSNKFIHFFEKSTGLFNEREIKDLFLLTLNYYMKKARAAEVNSVQQLAYFEKGFALYKTGLDTQVLFVNGELRNTTYSNIVRVGLRLKEYEWTRYFIHEYKSKLTLESQESYFNYNLAQLYYMQKNFQKAMPLLSAFEDRNDLLINCRTKILQIKMLWEDDSLETSLNFLDNFRKYLLRKKSVLPEQRHASFFLFCKYFGKIINSMHEQRKNKKELFSELINTKNVAEKDWLLNLI